MVYTILSFAVSIVGSITHGRSNRLLFSVYRSRLTDPFTYFRMVGHVLGHSGFNHYFNNFMLILMIGPILEEKYGSALMLIMILLTAVITGIIFLIFSKKLSLCGASGIAFMLILLGAYVNIKSGTVPLTLILVAIAYIGREAYQGIVHKDGLSHMTHIVGGLCGAFLGYCLNIVGIKAISDSLNLIIDKLFSIF